ncbi:zonular occludens toxin domain-containing protein [Bacillus smithii]|uniref:zonular occludens toxin domain-containing protein n=1 Tax=Bacillus smithii TaxID=1479 RepID=UPI003D20AA60
MIDLYLGPVGSGKSYHALKRGIDHVKNRNSFVVANFPIRPKNKKEEDRWIYMEDFEPKDLIRLSFERKSFGHEGRALLIIDEAGIWFNSRDWQIDPQKRKEWIKFFSQTRKFGYDVILIVQDERMLDRQIRKLAEYHVKHIKLRNYKWMKLLPWQIFAAVRFWQGISFKGQVSFIFFNPFLAKRYDTMKLFKIDDELLQIAKENGIKVDK